MRLSCAIITTAVVGTLLQLLFSPQIVLSLQFPSQNSFPSTTPRELSAPDVSQRPPKSFSAQYLAALLPVAVALMIVPANAAGIPKSIYFDAPKELSSTYLRVQSKGWELARQKRTAAMKDLQEKGILTIDTDDAGNQFLRLPWIPDRRLPYKSLSVEQRLVNEVSAGAFGEITKDVMLHWVDTLKTRRQATKKQMTNSTTAVAVVVDGPTSIAAGASSDSTTTAVPSSSSEEPFSPLAAVLQMKSLYAGFPVVAVASIPQGGMFFFVKKGLVELQTVYAPGAPEILSATVPIIFAVMAYWAFRTPAEVIKTQVQTGQVPSVAKAVKLANAKGLFSLWKYYPVMLSLDIPFQIINFILFGIVTDAVAKAGFPPNILSRLLCGMSCGMIAAAITCPSDVAKTRIISREKSRELALQTSAMTSPASSCAVNNDLLDKEAGDPNDPLINGGVNAEVSSEQEYSSVAVMRPTVAKSVIEQSQHTTSKTAPISSDVTNKVDLEANNNMFVEILKISKEEGVSSLFLGFKQRLLYTGVANGIRLAAYGTSRMDLMMRSLDDL